MLTIPCEKIARTAAVLRYFPDSADEWTNSIRLEDDLIIATNRCYMVVERHKGGKLDKPVHITADTTFLDQCKQETQYSSSVIFVVNDVLGIVSARTTLGYQYPGNLRHVASGDNALDRWRSIIPAKPAKSANTGLLLSMAHIEMLAETSPSRSLVFEQYVDLTQRSIVRDSVDTDWFAIFWSKDHDRPHDPAVLPEWFKS